MSRPGPNGIFLKIAMEMNKANTCKYSMYTFVHKHQHVTPEWMKRFVFHISTSTMIFTYTVPIEEIDLKLRISVDVLKWLLSFALFSRRVF